MLYAIALAALSQSSGPPCEVISRPTDHWGHFESSFIVADVSLRVTEGLTDCTFTRADVGSCLLIDPKTLLVRLDGHETWFAVPDGRGADLHFTPRGVTCTTRPLVRMD